MSKTNECLIAQDQGKLQIPYVDYQSLMKKVQDARKLQSVKNEVVSNLKAFLGGEHQVDENMEPVIEKAPEPVEETAEPVEAQEKVAVEFEPEPIAQEEQPVEITAEPVTNDVPEPAVQEPAPAEAAPKAARKINENMNVPPIKQDIADNFNKLDESGRLFSVFKQYYTCLNDTCGGTVRVTMKDGFCSLWNYDEWEEFAFIDLFEEQLRISVDPRYTAELQSLSLCEVPRLLSSRRSLISVQVDGLSNIMLDVLVKAFEEVGLTAS